MGSGGQCPSPTYKSNGTCCCGNGCCWNRCTWNNPPEDCLNGVIKGHWMFDTIKGYFTTVKCWNGSGMNYSRIKFLFTYFFLYNRNLYPVLSEIESLNIKNMKLFIYHDSGLDCSGTLKPKGCVQEAFLFGPKDVGGRCPSGSHKYRKNCCCASGCCWGKCTKEKPPTNCLERVPNSQWVFNSDKVFYQAVRNLKKQGTSSIL